MPIIKKFAELRKKKLCRSFFGKVVGLQHPNLLKFNHIISVFLGITGIMF